MIRASLLSAQPVITMAASVDQKIVNLENENQPCTFLMESFIAFKRRWCLLNRETSEVKRRAIERASNLIQEAGEARRHG